jgi:hypothetical protein
MSLTIGIGMEMKNESFISQLAEIAKQIGYEIPPESSKFEREVSECMETLAKLKKWKVVLSVKAPAGGAANLAFGVYEELVALQTRKIRPRFFDFCELLAQSAHQNGIQNLGIIFVTEWHPNDKIRISYGNVKRLETILSLPGHCVLTTINLQTGRIDEWDELPFYYELDCTDNIESL